MHDFRSHVVIGGARNRLFSVHARVERARVLERKSRWRVARDFLGIHGLFMFSRLFDSLLQ